MRRTATPPLNTHATRALLARCTAACALTHSLAHVTCPRARPTPSAPPRASGDTRGGTFEIESNTFTHRYGTRINNKTLGAESAELKVGDVLGVGASSFQLLAA